MIAERNKTFFMEFALKEAEIAYKSGEIPVGAVIVHEGKIIASNHNRVLKLNNPVAHAEILVIKEAAHVLNNYRLKGTELYVTIEPCPMCISAMIHGRIDAVYFGARNEKCGYMTRFNMDLSIWNHKIKVFSGILEEQSASILKDFFIKKRLK